MSLVRSAILLAALGVCAVTSARQEPLKVGLTFRGADSRIRYRDTQLILNQDQWNRTWARNLGTPVGSPKAATVDFTKNVIVAVFGGPMSNAEGFEFVEGIEQESVVVVRVQPVRYQVVGQIRRSTPYGFFVLPRIAKPYRIEENVQSLIGQPPVWKPRTELLAPPAR